MGEKYLLGLYEKALPASFNIEQKLVTTKELGYDYLEMSVDESNEKLKRLDWTALERKELLDKATTIGLPIRSMCLSGQRKYPLGSTDSEVAENSLLILKKAIQLADALGIRVIQIPGYDVYYEHSDEKTKDTFLRNLCRSAEIASKYGVSLGFETMENEFMNTVEKAMHYINTIISPFLGAYPDCGNLKNASLLYGTDMYNDIALGTGHMFAMHLKETLPGRYREIPFGTGHVDFEAVIKSAWNAGTRRFVTGCWDIGDGLWRSEINRVLEIVRPILDSF